MTALIKLTFVLFQKACRNFPFTKTFLKFMKEKTALEPAPLVNAFVKRIKSG
jgi:hypothetical protein